jgi:hypothetical protein
VEADELYQGKRENPLPSKQRGDRPYTKRGKSGPAAKRVVIGLVERGGHTRLVHINHATAESVRDVVVRNVSRESALHTDESRPYTTLRAEFDAHGTVHHASGEYVRYEETKMVMTNTIENVFSVFRRGMHGVYQHCGEAQAPLLAEFEFRYNRRSGLVSTTRIALLPPLRALKASASPMCGLTKPRTLRQLARRLYRRRKWQNGPK